MAGEMESEGPLIHIHEDDWGMRNLYPAAALGHAEADMAAGLEHARKAFDGIGYSSMYVIKAPDITFADVGLEAAAIETALSPLMPRVRQFHATIWHFLDPSTPRGERDPYGAYEDDALCFGFDAGCFIKIDCREGAVRSIWFEARGAPRPEMERLKAGLLALQALTPCAIADYWLDETGPLSDPAFAAHYFAALDEQEAG